MLSNYIIYFNTLSKELQIEHLLLIIASFMVMLFISFILDNIQKN